MHSIPQWTFPSRAFTVQVGQHKQRCPLFHVPVLPVPRQAMKQLALCIVEDELLRSEEATQHQLLPSGGDSGVGIA